jgi:hypothetical protein
MHGLWVAECAALGHLHRVDIAYKVADRGIGRRQLLGIAFLTVPPVHWQIVAHLRRQ